MIAELTVLNTARAARDSGCSLVPSLDLGFVSSPTASGLFVAVLFSWRLARAPSLWFFFLCFMFYCP
jgi:hypothetical protein